MKVEDFTIRERNVLTLPQGVREASQLGVGTHGKAVAVHEGIVMLIADPALVDDLAARVAQWLNERVAQDPWARLNEALAADCLEKVPTERYVAAPEPDSLPDTDRIAQLYGDDARSDQPERRWQE